MTHEMRRRLLISMSAGLVAAVIVTVWMKRERDRFENRYEMTTVLRARRYVPAGETVGPDLVRLERVPTLFVEPKALQTVNELTDGAGHPLYRARTSLMKGSQLTRGFLTDAAAGTGLAFTLPSGQTAMSLRLSPEAAVGPFVDPGDAVHVFWRPSRHRNDSDVSVRLLLSNARVLAVQDRAWHRPRPPADTAKPIAEENLLITLMVTPVDAARLALAQENGSLSLALVSPLDTGSLSLEALRLERLNKGE